MVCEQEIEICDAREGGTRQTRRKICVEEKNFPIKETPTHQISGAVAKYSGFTGEEKGAVEKLGKFPGFWLSQHNQDFQNYK